MASTDIAVIDHEAVTKALLDGIELPEVESGEDASRSIVARILASEDAETVLADSAATPAQEVLGRPLQVYGVRWLRSAYEEGPVVFALLDVADIESGERMTVSCGARNVMAQLLRLDQLGALPVAVVIRKADKATANGYYPLWLAKAEVA